MPDLNLSLAIDESDHVRDLTTGVARTSRVSITPLHGPIEDLLYRHCSRPSAGATCSAQCSAALNQRQTVASGQTREKNRIAFPSNFCITKLLLEED